jgi:hypothetical protein
MQSTIATARKEQVSRHPARIPLLVLMGLPSEEWVVKKIQETGA